MAVIILASLSLSSTCRLCGLVAGTRLGSGLAAFGTPGSNPKHPASYRVAMRRDAERGQAAPPAATGEWPLA